MECFFRISVNTVHFGPQNNVDYSGQRADFGMVDKHDEVWGGVMNAPKVQPWLGLFLDNYLFATRCHSYADRLRSQLSVSGAMPRREAMCYTAIR